MLSLVDKCAAIVAMRHARSAVLTASVDSVAFLTSMNVGNIIVLKGRLNAVFGSSMEAEVQVFSENALNGARRLTTRAFVTMVAVGDDGRPHPAATLRRESEDEERRFEAATKRREARLLLRDSTH